MCERKGKRGEGVRERERVGRVCCKIGTFSLKEFHVLTYIRVRYGMKNDQYLL